MTTAARILWWWTIVALCCQASAGAEEDDVRRILAQYDAMEDRVTVGVGGATARTKNGRTDYVMTALDTQPGTPDPSTLGMGEPINANFYYGGFVRIQAGTAQTGHVKPKLSKGADHTGTACVTAVWELKDDTFTMNFTLLPDSSALMVELTSRAGAADKTPFLVRFRIYPQSFNRSKHGKPRANFLLSSTGKRFESGTIQSFGATEKWVYLGDAKYAGKEGGAAVGVDTATVKDLRIHLGNYAVGADLSFKPGKTVRCYLVDFGKREIKDAPKEVPILMSAEASRFKEWSKSTGPAARGNQ